MIKDERSVNVTEILYNHLSDEVIQMKKVNAAMAVVLLLILSACAGQQGQTGAGDQSGTSATETGGQSSGTQSDGGSGSDQSSSESTGNSADEAVVAGSSESTSADTSSAGSASANSVSGSGADSPAADGQRQAEQAVAKAAGYARDKVYADTRDDGAYYSIELRENHSGDSATDPSTAPSIGFFRYYKADGKITKLDVITNKYKQVND